MIKLLAAIALSGTPPAAEPCLRDLSTAMEGPLKSCSDEAKRALVEDELRAFLRGDKSMIGVFLALANKQGKLDAVVERMRRMATFKSSEGYGKVNWGASGGEVRKAYPEARPAKNGTLDLAGEVVDFPSRSVFVFAAGKLVRVALTFSRDHGPLSAENYVRDFERVEGLLTQKYGGPDVDVATVREPTNAVDTMKEEIGGVGRAVRSGLRVLRESRLSGKTRVDHLLFGDQGEIIHQIVYSSVELAELHDVAETSRLLGDL